MKAEEIDLRQLLEFRPDIGKLNLNDRRMLIFSQAAFGQLRKLLVEHIGHEFTNAVLAQFGYRSGSEDYAVIAGEGDWDSDVDRLASGPVTHMWEGLVHVEPTTIEFNRDTGDFFMTGVWRNSYEAENYLEHFGVAQAPVCFSLTGYASGWGTSFFNQDLLAVEVTCVACGDEFCSFEIRPAAEWGDEAEPWRSALAASTDSIAAFLEKQVDARTRDLAEANRELIKAKDSAESANRTKSQFLANVSHELRTPMNGVLGIAELLRDSGLDSRQRELVELMIEAGQHQVAIISDLLDYSKIEAGQMFPEYRRFNVPRLLRSVVSTFTSQANRKGVDLTLSISNSVPNEFVCDSTKLYQILANLIGNAIKFTPSGGTVDVGAELRDASLSVSVVDSGIGITADQLPTLFTPFVQADDSTTRRYGGTGLGLAISKELAEMLDGDLLVDAPREQGAAFELRVPIRTLGMLDTPRPSELRSTSLVQPEEPEAQPKREAQLAADMAVLLAEDNPLNAMIMTEFLSKVGCSVHLTQDGQGAIEAAAANWFDLIMLDLHMPVLGGTEAVRRIRALEAESHIPRQFIVASTADAYDETRTACLDAGFDDFLTKPIGWETVRQLVEKARLKKIATST